MICTIYDYEHGITDGLYQAQLRSFTHLVAHQPLLFPSTARAGAPPQPTELAAVGFLNDRSDTPAKPFDPPVGIYVQ